MNRKNQIKGNINGGTTAPPNYKPPRAGLGGGYDPHVALGGAKQPRAFNKPQPTPQAAPQQTPMPWDVQASNDEAAALRKRNNTVTGLDDSWLRTQQQYGLEGPWADQKTNPYSEAALLQRKADQAQMGTMNSYAAAGHLYSGANVRAHEGNNFSFDLARNNLANQYAAAGAQYQGERAGADDAFNEAKNEAGWNRVQAGIESEPDTTTAPAAQKNKKPNKPRKDEVKKNVNGKKGKR